MINELYKILPSFLQVRFEFLNPCVDYIILLGNVCTRHSGEIILSGCVTFLSFLYQGFLTLLHQLEQSKKPKDL